MSVDFEPVKLDPSHRRIDLLVVGIVIVGLAIVLLKPWDGRPVTAPITSVASAAPAPQSSAPPARPAAPVAQVIDAPTWGEIASVVTARRAWGVRALVLDPTADTPTGGRVFAERWVEASVRADDASAAEIELDARPVVAIGITFPPGSAALDVRIWRVTGDALEPVEIGPIPPAAPQGAGGAFLFVRPATGGGGVGPWGIGTYRIDVSTAQGIERITLSIDVAAPPQFRNPQSA